MHRHTRLHREATPCLGKRRKTRSHDATPPPETPTLEQAAAARVAAALSERFAWFLNPVRILALAEDLRVVQRLRALHLGGVVVSVILSALSRTSDAEGRVRDAFALYRQIHPDVVVSHEGFRRAVGRAADVLAPMLFAWLESLARTEAWAPLRGRLAFFRDVRITDSTSFKLLRALAGGLPGAGSAAALKLHAVYSLRADGPVSVEATAGHEHDSPHFNPVWMPGALYLWDLGYNDYPRAVRAHLAGAFFAQRLKNKANPRVLAWHDPAGRRHPVARGERGALPDLESVLSGATEIPREGVLDLEVVLSGESVEGSPCAARVRVVCVPTDGTDRYYLTNLPREHFTPYDVAELYAARWEIELILKDWQGGCRLDEVARLRDLDTLRAVIYGGLLAHLLARELARAAADPLPTPPPLPASDLAALAAFPP
jgi:hypothetical protein